MSKQIFQIALVVKDYDEAIDFYCNKLQFVLEEDTILSPGKRWVIISPEDGGNNGCKLLLAKAADEEQERSVGNQTGGRVFLFMHTDDFEKDHKNLIEQKINIVRGPVKEPYGTVLVFEDLYGNLWDLIGPPNTLNV
jgi:catechol 2,3-dioxygenase-like lactoylglutathione lyase family enzyme